MQFSEIIKIISLLLRKKDFFIENKEETSCKSILGASFLHFEGLKNFKAFKT